MQAVMPRARLFKRAAAWLLLLGPFFYLSYGVANWWASTRAQVPSVAFGWERQVPFLAWSIFPYWSLNLIYAGTIFLGRNQRAIDRHALRLLTAQVIAVSCFMLWPLHFSFEQPAVSGAPGVLFSALRGFDKPYNQAPSLHIALAVILWDWCRGLLRARWARGLLLLWMLLICASVLTTRQHHFIDIPTGALLGLLCVWLWPLGPRLPMARLWRLSRDGKRRALALAYALGGALCLALALLAGARGVSAALWLAWPAASLALVAACYLGLGARGFAIDCRGRMHWAARWLFAPYRLGAAINAWAWTRRWPPANEIVPGLWLGRLPAAAQWRRAGAPLLVSLCAELQTPRPAHAQGKARCLPLLDLTAPAPAQLRRAAALIESQRLRAQGQGQAVWVCCALGCSRSAACVMAWLLLTRRAASVAEAEATLCAARPAIALSPAVRAALQALLDPLPAGGTAQPSGIPQLIA
jgi:hypothetical protein